MSKAIFWCRNDLRLRDNPGLSYTLRHHDEVAVVYIDEADLSSPSASVWWRFEALTDFAEQLDGKLIYRYGNAKELLPLLLDELSADAVYWNRCYEPKAMARDAELKQQLKDSGTTVASFPGNLLVEPWEVLKGDETPYRVFTPFYKAALKQGFAEPYDNVESASLSQLMVAKSELQQVKAKAQRPWMSMLAEHWSISTQSMDQRIDVFLSQAIDGYGELRNVPAVDGCSRLSPYLHFGQVSPREIVARAGAKHLTGSFIRELVWREFSHYVLYHWPTTEEENMDSRFDVIPWINNADQINAWQKGLTGIPMVDAGMRELWQTGYMHNRVRMIVASLLTKHMMVDWREGAKWFMDTLVDADVAQNSLSWQWTAGSGVDAAPYFRIFNPVTQGEKFDPKGDYVRRWVPELAELPDKWIHQPWAAPEEICRLVKFVTGKDYPLPIVDLKSGRERALSVWETIKGAAA